MNYSDSVQLKPEQSEIIHDINTVVMALGKYPSTDHLQAQLKVVMAKVAGTYVHPVTRTEQPEVVDPRVSIITALSQGRIPTVRQHEDFVKSHVEAFMPENNPSYSDHSEQYTHIRNLVIDTFRQEYEGYLALPKFPIARVDYVFTVSSILEANEKCFDKISYARIADWIGQAFSTADRQVRIAKMIESITGQKWPTH